MWTSNILFTQLASLLLLVTPFIFCDRLKRCPSVIQYFRSLRFFYTIKFLYGWATLGLNINFVKKIFRGLFGDSKFLTRKLSLTLRTNFFLALKVLHYCIIVHVFFNPLLGSLAYALSILEHTVCSDMTIPSNNLHLFLIPCPSVLFFNVLMIDNAVQFHS